MDQSTHYDAVLADLRAQRDQIDQAIEVLMRIRGGVATPLSKEAPLRGTDAPDDAGAFLGMSLAEASVKLLGMRKKAMTNVEICDALRKGGLVLNSQDPANVVSSVLARRFASIGDVVRVDRGTWGLKAWYPNKTFKTKAAAAAEKRGDGAGSESHPIDAILEAEIQSWSEDGGNNEAATS